MLEVPKDVMSEACRDVETALKNFFDSKSGKRKGPRMAFPNKKKKGKSKDSFRLPGEMMKVVEEKGGKVSKIKIGKLGVVKLLEPIDLSSWHLLSFTISRKAGRHFISFCVRRPEKSRIRKVVKPMSIGVDLGVRSLVSYSNGTSKEGPKSLKKALKKLARLQKRASRKFKKGERASKNLAKARKKVAALHLKITNVRKDFIEKETTRISRKYDLTCVETLNVKGMVRNHKLARSLSDQSFGNFISTLERKQTKYGNLVLKAGQFFPSSKRCRRCGTKNQGLTLADRTFKCENEKCGHEEDRDLHAAINIQHEAIKKYSEATEESTPGETTASDQVSQETQVKRGRRTRKGTKDSVAKTASQESPDVKYTKRQNPYLIKMSRKR